jgi:cation diffusion facilitator CzcD-associated flavoprotein CzcO
MPPTAVVDTTPAADVSDIAGLKAKVAAKPALPDNYMYDFEYNHALPTTDALGTKVPEDTDATKVAEDLLAALSSALSKGDADAFTALFLEHGVWRDKLAYTWDYRTFNFRASIAKAAADLLPSTRASKFELFTPLPAIQRPYPDLEYLQFCAKFDTPLVHATAMVNAVFTKEGWKIWTLHTVAEDLIEFPELPPADGHMTGDISFEAQREKDDDEIRPDVLIVGGGQNGLALAARLKALGVPTLIVERAATVGEVWRKRYEYLSLHFPHWADHLPYFPYPEHWPTYTPAQKQGMYMEWYAQALELPIWASSSVVDAKQDANGWTVNVNKGGIEVRTLHPKHVVMATSLCGVPMTPQVPGLEQWKGTARHSTAHDSSRNWVGKKVLVVGTSSSGFDTAYDCARRDIDVTILQRSPTYIMSLTHSVPRAIGGYEPKNGVRPDLEEQDRIAFAMPVGPGEELGRRNAEVLENLDRELLDGLNAKGLRTWRGQRGTGNGTLGQTRNGGFYFDAGACEQIINGKIKVEQGAIERFTADKVVLTGGREREYDLVVFATGFSSTVDSVKATLGEEIASRCGPIWGIDEEGEFRSAYKHSGVDNLWMMVGYLPYTRYHSKRLAIRLKALIEGVSPAPYTA